ncbi:MAG: helix-turn-helix domain-containing protein [Ktedonobacteraceae bacterium]|nr:helix-turn-helix domain-containing protein [Ktedonobacteraceae bacterium]
MPYTEDGEVYLTVKEACQRLGISRQALDGYVERGQLTKYRRTLARRVFFKESEIHRLLELRRADDEDR